MMVDGDLSLTNYSKVVRVTEIIRKAGSWRCTSSFMGIMNDYYGFQYAINQRVGLGITEGERFHCSVPQC